MGAAREAFDAAKGARSSGTHNWKHGWIWVGPGEPPGGWDKYRKMHEQLAQAHHALAGAGLSPVADRMAHEQAAHHLAQAAEHAHEPKVAREITAAHKALSPAPVKAVKAAVPGGARGRRQLVNELAYQHSMPVLGDPQAMHAILNNPDPAALREQAASLETEAARRSDRVVASRFSRTAANLRAAADRLQEHDNARGNSGRAVPGAARAKLARSGVDSFDGRTRAAWMADARKSGLTIPRGAPAHEVARLVGEHQIIGRMTSGQPVHAQAMVHFRAEHAARVAKELGGPTPHAAAHLSQSDIEARIQAAYHAAPKRGDYVMLADLRSQLGNDIPRAQLDEALRQFGRKEHVFIYPHADQKNLTAADHAAAVHIGGEAKHMMKVEPAGTAPTDRMRRNMDVLSRGGYRNEGVATGAKPTPIPGAARAKLKAAAQTSVPSAAHLRDLPSREAAHAALKGLTKPQLVEMAKGLSISGAAGTNMTQLREMIVEATVGDRLDVAALHGFFRSRP